MQHANLTRMTLPVFALLAAVMCGGCSNGDSGKAGTSKEAKPAFFKDETTPIEATVEAIDLRTRTLTLKGPAGGSATFMVDEQVKHLDKVKVGDRVRADYYESIAVQVRRPAGSDVDAWAATASTAGPASKPSGITAGQITVTATVDRIDRKKPSVTLRGPAGNTRTFRVRDRRNLNNVEVGDEVVLTYTEALAVAVKEVGQ